MIDGLMEAPAPAAAPIAPSAPAAPAAPAAATGPELSPFDKFIQQSREKLSSGQQALPGFTAQPTLEAQAAADAAAQPATTGGVPAADPAKPEPTRAADGTFEAPDENAVQAEGEPAPDPLMVELPGRGPNSPPVAIAVDDPEVAERLRQLNNGYMRGEEVRSTMQALQADRQELEQIEVRMQVDPEGFIFENIPKDRQASLAIQMIAELSGPQLQNVINVVTGMADPDTQEVIKLRLENDRNARRGQAQEQHNIAIAERRSVQGVKQAIAMHVPADMPEAQQVALYDACFEDVRQYVQRSGNRVVDPRDVPLLIAQRLRQAGVDPLQVSQTLRSGPGRSNTAPAPATPRVARAVKAPGATSQGLSNTDARRALALGSPTGLTPSTAGMERAPKGQKIEERIAWARQNLKFGTANP